MSSPNSPPEKTLTGFLHCPYEIIIQILKCAAIQFPEIRSLRLTNSIFRTIIDPIIFHTFRFNLDHVCERGFAIKSLDTSAVIVRPVYEPEPTKLELQHTAVETRWRRGVRRAKETCGLQREYRLDWIERRRKESKQSWEKRKALQKEGIQLSRTHSAWNYLRPLVKHVRIQAIGGLRREKYDWRTTKWCSCNDKPDMHIASFLSSFPNIKTVAWHLTDETRLPSDEIALVTEQIYLFCEERGLPPPELNLGFTSARIFGLDNLLNFPHLNNLRRLNIGYREDGWFSELSYGSARHTIAALVACSESLTELQIEIRPFLPSWLLQQRQPHGEIYNHFEKIAKSYLDLNWILSEAARLIDAKSGKSTRNIKSLKLHNVFMPRNSSLTRRFLGCAEDVSYTFDLDTQDARDSAAWNSHEHGYVLGNISTLTLSRLSLPAFVFMKGYNNLTTLTIAPPRYRDEFPGFDEGNIGIQDQLTEQFWTEVAPVLKHKLSSLAIRGSCVSPAWTWEPASPAANAVAECKHLTRLEMCACGVVDYRCYAHDFIQSVLRWNKHVEELVVWHDPHWGRTHDTSATPGNPISCLQSPSFTGEEAFDLEGFEDNARRSLTIVFKRPRFGLRERDVVDRGDLAETRAFFLSKRTVVDHVHSDVRGCQCGSGNEKLTWQYSRTDLLRPAMEHRVFRRPSPSCYERRPPYYEDVIAF